VPDDPLADLGKRLDTQLGQVDRKLGGLEKSAHEAATARRELQHQLEALGQRIDTDRAALLARTARLEARAEHDRQFGHYQLVRRGVTGMLRAMAVGTVRPAALLRAAEQLMIEAAGYWLAPAQLALAAWVDDSRESAERAVLEAVNRDPGRSALFFSLVLARFGRPDAAARWVTEYAAAQDRNALTGEFTAVLDAVARGALGAPARERLLDACRGWRDQLGPSDEREAASWTEFIRAQRPPRPDTFHPLGTVSRSWAATLGRLETATAFGHTEQWLKDLPGGASEGDQPLRAAVDDLLRDLIATPDQAEGALLEAAGGWQAVVESGDDPASSEPAPTDFLTLCTAIATGAYPGKLSAQAVRFCLVISAASVQRAVTGLSQQVRSTYPASLEVEIEGWHQAVEPGDDPDALVRKFLDWADQAMTEEKDQATRKRLSIARPSTRLEQIESSWQARKRRGQETVYLATAQADNFFRDWKHGIAAGDRCIDLLRAQPAGAWGDAQESRPVAVPVRPAMELPAWEPRPPR